MMQQKLLKFIMAWDRYSIWKRYSECTINAETEVENKQRASPGMKSDEMWKGDKKYKKRMHISISMKITNSHQIFIEVDEFVTTLAISLLIFKLLKLYALFVSAL